MESIACILCGSTCSDSKFALSDFFLERADVSATLVQCNQCGLIYQNPRPTLAEMSFHYPSEYEPYTHNFGSQNTPWLNQRATQHGVFKRCSFVTRHKRAGRLLDIGCASGTFLRGMQEQGNWELYGVEISEFAAQIARERYHLNVYTGTLEQASFPDGFFDVVTLWDVLEHIHDPAASLREIHRVLKPEGLLLTRVPNIESWDAKMFGRYWAGLDAPRHLYIFTPHTLSELLIRTGFKVMEFNYGAGIYPIFLLNLRFWLVARGMRAAFRQALLDLLRHPVTSLLVSPAFYVVGKFLPGPLLVTTATKLTQP